jgi:hypothetical protein
LVSAGKEESSDEEDSKEDRKKEEISFPLQVHSFFGPEE